MKVGNCFGLSNPKFVVCLASLLGGLLFVLGLPCLFGFGLGQSKNFFKFSEAIPRDGRFHRTKTQATQQSTHLPWVLAVMGLEMIHDGVEKKRKKMQKKVHDFVGCIDIFLIFVVGNQGHIYSTIS